MVMTRLGRAKGKRSKKAMPPNRSGYCLAGSAKKPPKLGPTTDPMLQTRGMMEKAFGWSSFWGTISATMVRMIPTGGVSVVDVV